MTEKIFQKHSGIYKLGVAFIAFWSFVIGALHFGVLYLFGIPIIGLLLGVFFVWISKESIKHKLISTFISIPIILGTFFIVFQLNKAEPETFLIPQNFRGKIIIFYEEPCGQKSVYENGRRIFQFPESGVLITNYKRTKGILNQNFYFVAENGEKTKIPQKDVREFNFKGRLSNIEKEPSREEVGVFYSYAGILPSKTISKYHSYVISAYKDLDKDEKESWLELKRFSDQSENLLIKCREQVSK